MAAARRTSPSAAATASGVGQPGLERQGGRGEPVREVVRERAAHRRDRRQRPCGPVSTARPSRRRGSRRRWRRTCAGAPAPAGGGAITTGSSAKPMATSVGSLLGEDARLGRLVAVHAGVPVEVVRRQVEPRPRRRRGTLASRPGGSSCTRRRTRRRRGRARRRAATSVLPASTARTPAASQHRHGEQRRRRLAVGAGDGEHRAWAARPLLLPAVGELELAHDGTAGRRGDREQRVRLGHAGRRHDELAGRHELGAAGGGRARSTSSTPSSAASARLASSTVSSDATTSAPRRCSARTVAAPAMARPWTRITACPPRCG